MPARTDKQPLNKQYFTKCNIYNYLIISAKYGGGGKCRKIKNRRGFRVGRGVFEWGVRERHIPIGFTVQKYKIL
jgi:hypothetical protein